MNAGSLALEVSEDFVRHYVCTPYVGTTCSIHPFNIRHHWLFRHVRSVHLARETGSPDPISAILAHRLLTVLSREATNSDAARHRRHGRPFPSSLPSLGAIFGGWWPTVHDVTGAACAAHRTYGRRSRRRLGASVVDLTYFEVQDNEAACTVNHKRHKTSHLLQHMHVAPPKQLFRTAHRGNSLTTPSIFMQTW